MLQVVLSLRPMSGDENIQMLSDLLWRLGLVHNEALQFGLDLALKHGQRWAFEKAFEVSTDENAKVPGEDHEPTYVFGDEPEDKRQKRLAEIAARRARWKAFCASVRTKTRAAFRARWQPADVAAVLELDDIAAAIGIDAPERVEKLRIAVRGTDDHYAFIAAERLASLDAFDADVEAVLWRRVEAPVVGVRHGGPLPDGTWDAGWQLFHRFQATDLLVAHAGPSDRLTAALLRLADTPGFQLRESKELLPKLKAAGLDGKAASAWIASRLENASAGEVAREGIHLIEGSTLPIAVASRALLIIMAAGDHHDAAQAAGFLAQCLGIAPEEGEGDDGEGRRPRRYAWSWDPEHPALRREFFRRAHEQDLPSWLDELLWELGAVAPALLQDYRAAVDGDLGAGDRWAALEDALQQRRVAAGSDDATESQIVNFAREWLAHRLAKHRVGEEA